MSRVFDANECIGYEGCIYCVNGICNYDTATIKLPWYMACNEPLIHDDDDQEV